MLPTLAYECSEFLMESRGQPLLKNLPKNRDGFSKVKVRHQKMTNTFVESFNGAFSDAHTKLLQRSVLATGQNGFVLSESADLEPFYIFPVNGYRYMYNPVASTKDYNDTFNTLLNTIGDSASDILKDLLKYDYVFDNLSEGICNGSEIIFYGIPYYFALRKSLVDDYTKFFEE